MTVVRGRRQMPGLELLQAPGAPDERKAPALDHPRQRRPMRDGRPRREGGQAAAMRRTHPQAPALVAMELAWWAARQPSATFNVVRTTEAASSSASIVRAARRATPRTV